jgi:hypothetical protein
VSVDYVTLCNKMSPRNPHRPDTLLFEHAPRNLEKATLRDAMWLIVKAFPADH